MTDHHMSIDPTIEVLYVKRGRRYQPWGNLRQYHPDTMQAGTFRLTHCPEDGLYRHTTDVTPDTASFLAATAVAQWAMEQAITNKAIAAPAPTATQMTPKQMQLVEQFRLDMAEAGGLVPEYWQHSSPYEIVKAGIDAITAIHEYYNSERKVE